MDTTSGMPITNLIFWCKALCFFWRKWIFVQKDQKSPNGPIEVQNDKKICWIDHLDPFRAFWISLGHCQLCNVGPILVQQVPLPPVLNPGEWQWPKQLQSICYMSKDYASTVDSLIKHIFTKAQTVHPVPFPPYI